MLRRPVQEFLIRSLASNAARLIKTQYPDVLVLGFSADLKKYNVYAMQQAGDFEVLPKEDALKDLYAAIQRAVAAIQSNAANNV